MEANIQTIMEAALQQGIWAALYIYLFFRMLKENAAREEKYQAMIDSLSTNIAEGIEDIQICIIPMMNADFCRPRSTATASR